MCHGIFTRLQSFSFPSSTSSFSRSVLSSWSHSSFFWSSRLSFWIRSLSNFNNSTEIENYILTSGVVAGLIKVVIVVCVRERFHIITYLSLTSALCLKVSLSWAQVACPSRSARLAWDSCKFICADWSLTWCSSAWLWLSKESSSLRSLRRASVLRSLASRRSCRVRSSACACSFSICRENINSHVNHMI